MNTRELQSRLQDGRSRAESTAQAVNTNIDLVKAGIGITWFIALGRVCSAITEFFKNYGKYFFLASLIVGLISWIVSTVEFATAGNKNLGKIANFIYITFNLAFYFATAATFLLAGLFAGGIMLFISMFMDPAVNLGRAIFYGIKAALEKDPEKNYYFKHRAFSHGMAAGIGSAVSAAFVMLMLFTTMSLGLAIPLGMLGIGVAIAAVFLVPKIINRLMGPQPTKVIKLSLVCDDSDEELTLLPDPSLQRSYYDNVLTEAPHNLTQLYAKIELLIVKIDGERNNDRGTWLETFWPQESKRRNKIEALEALQKMIDVVEQSSPIPDAATKDEPYYFMAHPFHYTNKNEFCDQVKQLMISRYNGVFQSAFKKTGDVECCFNELFLCIINNSDLLYRDKSEEKDSLRSHNAI